MIAVGHLVGGALDRDRLHAAARALVERHEALRTSFAIDARAVTVHVSPEPRFGLHLVEPADRSLEAFRRQALPLIFEDVDPRRPGSLVRIVAADYGDCWRFTIAAHHAITDGFSRGVMNRELLKLYAGEELAPAASYYDFARADDAPLTPEAQELVDTLPAPVRIVGDGVSQGTAEDAGQMATRDFEGLGRALKPLAQRAGATKFGVLAAAYALAVQGFTGDRGVSSFFQSEGRKSLGASNSVVGPFSNTLPLDLSVDPDRDFAAFARDVSERTSRSVAHETEPLLDGVLSQGKAPGISINMFPPASPIRAGDLEVGPREFLDRRTEFDLNLVWAEDRNVLTAHAYYDRGTLTDGRVQLFLDLLDRILRAAIDAPEATCREIVRAARAGHEVILPQTSLDPEPAWRLHQPFFETAARDPEATAIVTSRERISYGALAERVRSVTAVLQAAGVTAEDRVAVLAQRDPALVEAMLGVSASGASFALIDCTYPMDRIRYMLERLEARFMLCAGAPFPIELAGRVQVVWPDHAAGARAEIVDGPPRAHACHMFTSGTTGRPKMVTHPDTTLLRFVGWQAATLDLPGPVTTMMMAGLAHDPTLRDVFLPLCHGGTIAVPTAEEMARPEALRDLFRHAACNVVRFSPSTARLVTAGGADAADFASLRGIFWGGERLPASSVRTWRDLTPQARQFHVFGTTETPQAFLIHEITEAPDPLQRDIPMGRALPWTGARLVDEDGDAVSTGEVGEIVAELADPVEGTNRKRALPGAASACQHFTGDLGYQLSDGNIYFAGRRDGQVKINGFRVELGEIEATVEAMPGVERAFAALSGDRILLFATGAPETVTEAAVKATLARSLPSYMLPARILVVASFPLTRNGKVDRDALIALVGRIEQAEAATPQGAGPATEAEKAVAAVLAKATGRAVTDRSASLFDLGADSLSTIEARLELEAQGFALPENWEWMAVADLALCRAEADAAPEPTGWLQRTRRLDTFIVLRSLAIVTVVAHHTGWEIGVGASLVLLALAGYTFGRLHLPAILNDGRTGRIWALMAKLLVPLVPASLLIYAMHVQVGNSPHIATLLLYENVSLFFDDMILGVRNDDHHVIWLWFLHAYLQIFLVLGVLLAIPRLRSAMAADPWRGALVFFAITELVGAGLVLLLSAPLGAGDPMHVSVLLMRSPTTLLPFFALGALFAFSDTPRRQFLSIAAALVHLGIAQMVYANNGEVAWLLALGLCLFLPFVTLPRILTGVLLILSGNALMIYLSHRAVDFALERVFGSLFPVPVEIVAQLAVGVLLGIALRPILDRMGINLLANKRITFPEGPKGPRAGGTPSPS